MRRFLNRILGLPKDRQNLLFNYFGALLQADIRAAKAEGRYSEGMSDLPAAQISFACEPEVRAHDFMVHRDSSRQQTSCATWSHHRAFAYQLTRKRWLLPMNSEGLVVQTLWVDPHSGLKTQRNTLRVDRGVSFETRAAAPAGREHREGRLQLLHQQARDVRQDARAAGHRESRAWQYAQHLPPQHRYDALIDR